MRLRILSASVLTVVLVSCSEPYDPNNIIDDETFKECVDPGWSTGRDFYEEHCEGKSLDVTAFVISKDGDEYTMNRLPRKSSRFQSDENWYLYDVGRYFSYDEKLRVKAVIDDDTFLGSLTANAKEITKSPLSAEEKAEFAREEQEEEARELQGKTWIGYRRCADQIEATRPGVSCPKGDQNYTAPVTPDSSGVMTIEGICFFGDRPIYFECRAREYSASITKFEIQ